jgi:type II restriction enzyme
VGSNILLGQLPVDARIPIIENESVRPKSAVRRQWGQFLFLRDQRLDSRGWLSDVLACVRELDREFTLAEVYAFEERLATLHPRNRHIRPKIRQQLQVLRDKGIIDFLGRGKYQIK